MLPRQSQISKYAANFQSIASFGSTFSGDGCGDSLRACATCSGAGPQTMGNCNSRSYLRVSLGLFKGAVPRFFLIVPLGAMNFTGYELSRKVLMNKNQEVASERPPRKKFTNSG
ncbi:hypothetical protein MLD38_024198 [Melastoma candidum]|uniref:Uncharacterized protein n=1 Tax=Melastoma candidum TaxID=119954 RepID=A0ACB9NT96_9MYRT|nr:hypothetical protein MLD38_024198 [Melastoma candidum]